jgi:hypothetical protein
MLEIGNSLQLVPGLALMEAVYERGRERERERESKNQN